MLNELYSYALRQGLAARAGYKSKPVKGYMLLDADGCFLGIAPSVTKKTYAPDIGAMANGPRFCNPLVEKARYPLGLLTGDEKKDKNMPVKHACFLAMLADGAADDPLFAAAYRALTNDDTLQAMRARFLESFKPDDAIGFEADGTPLEQSPACEAWWARYRARFRTEEDERETLPRCLITGEASRAMATVPKVSGLLSVGGHTSGDAFLCFDKSAFQSYGLKQAANAPVSEEGITAVNAALEDLIRRADTLGGAKLVHWYDRDIQPAADPITRLLDMRFDDEQDTPAAENEAPENALNDTDTAPQAAPQARQSAAELLTAVYKGILPEQLPTRYYIMPLSGAGGRMMVRGWYAGSFETLYQNTILWFEDLCLVSPGGKSVTAPPKLKALCIRLLKPGGDGAKTFERMDKELSALLNRLFYAIVNGSPLPDEVPVRALYWLRSRMLRAGEAGDTRASAPESLAYQLLKAWLVRRQRMKGEPLMERELNKDYPQVSYHCGRMMAVYAAMQQEAMQRDVGASVVDRYYGAAITSPKTVLGTLSRQANYHLSKIENKAFAIRFRRMLDEISTHITAEAIPSLLNTAQQTEFALGYYQQQAAIYQKAESTGNTADNREEKNQ